jgi:hypothetical protein
LRPDPKSVFPDVKSIDFAGAALGLVNPQSMRIVVVFPAPLAPRNPNISPAWIDIEILLRKTIDGSPQILG